MAIIGNLIKGLIGLSDRFQPNPDHPLNQQQVLQHLIQKAELTAFGRAYQFSKILRSENMLNAFRTHVPYHDYHKIHDEWWVRLHEGYENVTWPGAPQYFALSSGTTGKKSKRIPVYDEMLEAIRKAGLKQIGALSNFDLPPAFFEKEILMLGSSTDLKQQNGCYEGEISGISAGNIPFWFKGYYRPGTEIASIADWDERVQRIAEEAPTWNIGAISGIPSWIELMLKKVMEYNGLQNIHEIWPNFEVYTSGGVAFQPYEKSFNELLGRPITVIDTYLASEGFIACQQRPDTRSMRLFTDNGIYFEFVPFKPEYINIDGSLRENAPALGISEVEERVEYVLVLSTVSGLWRYMIGDTIEFTDVEKAEIRITGRTKFFLNVVGSQLSVQKMNDAVRHLEEKYALKIPEFTLSAVRISGEFFHHWYLGMEDIQVSEEYSAGIDEYLQKSNKNYRVARNKALHGVKVSVIPIDIFHSWSEKNKKKGGQVKMEKVMDNQKFAEWESFVTEQLTN